MDLFYPQEWIIKFLGPQFGSSKWIDPINLGPSGGAWWEMCFSQVREGRSKFSKLLILAAFLGSFFLMATMAPARSWCRPSFTKKCHFGWAMQQDLLMASRSNAESANVRMVERGTSSLMGVSLQMQLLTGCFDYLNTVPIYLLLQQIPTQNPICRKLTGCKLGDPEKKEVLVRIHISVTMIPSWTAVSGYFNLGNPMENHHF